MGTPVFLPLFAGKEAKDRDTRFIQLRLEDEFFKKGGALYHVRRRTTPKASPTVKQMAFAMYQDRRFLGETADQTIELLAEYIQQGLDAALTTHGNGKAGE